MENIIKKSDIIQKILESNSHIKENKELYWMQGWAEDYFDINEKGNVIVSSNEDGPSVDLYEMVQSLVQRGIEPPILFRFDGIIRDRVKRLYNAFQSAIKEFDYKNIYQLAYPIKVNQQKQVVDTIRESGKNLKIGLEVGSKPELLAVLGLNDIEDSILLCNGYKDAEYIELALLERKLGRKVIIIIEQLYELSLVFEIAEKIGVPAELGFRMKPSNKGSGRWASSGGDRAKFGLDYHEILIAVNKLIEQKKEHWLKLLHFHIGSQITSIVPIKKALRESSRLYIELVKLCPSLCYFDIGGGLGIDYDGSKTSSDSSMNYNVEQYARDVVYTLCTSCNEEDIAHPIIVTESGRAIVAHHSVLVAEVIDVSTTENIKEKLPKYSSDHEIINELLSLNDTVNEENCHEVLLDAFDIKELIVESFVQGKMSLEERAYSEKILRHLIVKIRKIASKLPFIPDDIKQLDRQLIDTYFCNFSLFQSLPDSWAIDQIFPIMPIHRLKEHPSRAATIVDVSCDSDGMINNFVTPKGLSKHLQLHEMTLPQPYYLGFFLIGAYQEILGGLHNLFGDTNAVHIEIDENGHWEFKNNIQGDTINEVLSYVQYNSQELIEKMRLATEKALKEGRLTNEESAHLKKRYKAALESYTYLVV